MIILIESVGSMVRQILLTDTVELTADDAVPAKMRVCVIGTGLSQPMIGGG